MGETRPRPQPPKRRAVGGDSAEREREQEPRPDSGAVRGSRARVSTMSPRAHNRSAVPASSPPVAPASCRKTPRRAPSPRGPAPPVLRRGPTRRPCALADVPPSGPPPTASPGHCPSWPGAARGFFRPPRLAGAADASCAATALDQKPRRWPKPPRSLSSASRCATFDLRKALRSTEQCPNPQSLGRFRWLRRLEHRPVEKLPDALRPRGGCVANLDPRVVEGRRLELIFHRPRKRDGRRHIPEIDGRRYEVLNRAVRVVPGEVGLPALPAAAVAADEACRTARDPPRPLRRPRRGNVAG